MAEEILNVSPENPEEGPNQGPVETRVHPREIMGDALPQPTAQAEPQVPVKTQKVASRPVPGAQATPVIPALVEETMNERKLVYKILSGTSSADTQSMLTTHRRKTGVSSSHDTSATMKKVARDALSTN